MSFSSSCFCATSAASCFLRLLSSDRSSAYEWKVEMSWMSPSATMNSATKKAIGPALVRLAGRCFVCVARGRLLMDTKLPAAFDERMRRVVSFI